MQKFLEASVNHRIEIYEGLKDSSRFSNIRSSTSEQFKFNLLRTNCFGS